MNSQPFKDFFAQKALNKVRPNFLKCLKSIPNAVGEGLELKMRNYFFEWLPLGEVEGNPS